MLDYNLEKHVFNHQTNVDINNRIVCFDIKELGKVWNCGKRSYYLLTGE